jgi:hypothetical protein
VLSPGILAIGSDAGSVSRVGVFDSASGILLYEFNPYADIFGFTGGVRTAVGYVRDVSGASIFPLVITATGPGALIPNPASPGPVRIYSAVAGTLSNGQFVNAGQLLSSINPYPGFGGGIFLAAADFDRDGFTEVVTAADQGGGPRVTIISLSPLQPFRVFFDNFVYSPGFFGGVRVAAGDINGDGVPDLITGAAPGGGPHVKAFSGVNGQQFLGPAGSFYAYNPLFPGGVYVAAGDFNLNGRAEIVTGAGPGGGPHVRIIDPFGQDPANPFFDLSSRFAFEPTFTGGVRVAAAYIDTDFVADLIVARGPGIVQFPTDVIVTAGATFNVIYSGPAFVNPRFFGGTFPSSGKFAGEPLRIEGDSNLPADGVATITTDDAQLLLEAAVARFGQAGVPQSVLDELSTLEIQIGNLPAGIAGLAQPGIIILDNDAAGHGWFIDPTPTVDEEYAADGVAIDPDAIGRVDLFTVILHELGHQLGLEDLDPATDPHNLMTGTLNPGQRRLPDPNALEILFAGDSFLDHLMAPSLF